MTVFEFILWSPLMLAIVYPLGIKYEHPEGGKYKLLLPLYALAAILSVTVNSNGTEARPRNVALLACIKF